MNIKPLVTATILALTLFSCSREFEITKRAKQQLPISLKEEFLDFTPGFSELAVHNMKTVYENDSICLIQFTSTFKDTSGFDKAIDFRYIYLFDHFMSNSLGEAIFRECFKQIPCMPDSKIEECRKTVKKNKESVFNDAIGTTLRVREPFDKK